MEGPDHGASRPAEDPGGGGVSGPTIDEQIDALKRYLWMLKDDRRILNKKIIKNRQEQASIRVFLKKLQEEKRAKQ
jgi:hypothetical protein